MRAGVRIKAISFLCFNVRGQLNFNFITRRMWKEGIVRRGFPFKMWIHYSQRHAKNHNQLCDLSNKIDLEKTLPSSGVFVESLSSSSRMTFLADHYSCLFI